MSGSEFAFASGATRSLVSIPTVWVISGYHLRSSQGRAFCHRWEKSLGPYLDSIDRVHDGVLLLRSVIVRRMTRGCGETYSYSGKGSCCHVLQQGEIRRQGFIAAEEIPTISGPALAERLRLQRGRQGERNQGRKSWGAGRTRSPPWARHSAGPLRPQLRKLCRKDWSRG